MNEQSLAHLDVNSPAIGQRPYPDGLSEVSP